MSPHNQPISRREFLANSCILAGAATAVSLAKRVEAAASATSSASQSATAMNTIESSQPKMNWTVNIDPAARTVTMESAAMAMTLDIRQELTAICWRNKLTGQELPLGGPELEVSLDAADRRIWIAGWKCQGGNPGSVPTDDEEGFNAGQHHTDYDDALWKNFHDVAHGASKWPGCCLWARTEVSLPRQDEGKDVTLVLGGYGLYDFDQMRVFVNGHLIGQRTRDRFWSPPMNLRLRADDPAYRYLQWGQPNLLALQVGGQVTRTARLDALDPHCSRHFPGPEVLAAPFDQCLVLGEPVKTVRFSVTEVRRVPDEAVVFKLTGDCAPISATVTYRLNPSGAVLQKFTEVHNQGTIPARLMDIGLGSYRTDAQVSNGQRGFPVYASDAFFFSLAHPSGWVTGENGQVLLRQHPGCKLPARETFSCMEAVLGVARVGTARDAFIAHVRGRMRRVQRGHDRPYAIFENFGSWSLQGEESFKNCESACLHSIAQIAEGQRQTGCRFDLFSVDFWVDSRGDLTQFALDRFPRGLAKINRELRVLGIQPGLWIDSSMSGWSIGDNPAVQGTFTYNPEYPVKYWCGPFFCRATDPIKTLYTKAFRYHVRQNAVRLLKFDNLRSYCSSIHHEHLPGKYSTEPIHNAVIEMLHEIDKECPDVFVMLYWGYRSPWWLRHADTLFEPGLNMEAASPADSPTLYVRDGVTGGLDQAQWWCHDVPPLGKDSLGVWLSDWGWNDCIGAERWQEAFVMDLCRGSLLAQPWSDWNWLTPAERQQMADFIALLRAQPDCFANPRFILGNPWRYQTYGYCCTDGRRAFLAINNCTWDDADVPLQLNGQWGLPVGQAWDVYRWYPRPARMEIAVGADGLPHLALRPFEVLLLEVVPRGQAPSLGRDFPVSCSASTFQRPSRALPCDWREDAALVPLELPLEVRKDDRSPPQKRTMEVGGTIPAAPDGGMLVVTVELFRDGKTLARANPGLHFAAVATVGGAAVEAAPVVRQRGPYGTGWQAWRIKIASGQEERTLSLIVTVEAGPDVDIRGHVYFLPQDEGETPRWAEGMSTSPPTSP
ncbi:MAG: hypothetical protein WC869_04120 [Phycisphaerae bacterium]